MQKKAIRKTLLHVLATGLFIFVLSLNLSVSLSGNWIFGFNQAKADEGDSRIWIVKKYQVTCADFIANQTIVSSSGGQVGVSLQLGSLGTYSAGVNPGSAGTTTTTLEIAVHYPKNPDGSAVSWDIIGCLQGGTEPCTPTSPCKTLALQQIGI